MTKLKMILACALLSVAAFWSPPLSARVIETQRIEEVLPYLQDNSLVFFNIAEVLTDSQISLGSSNWRRYVRRNAPEFHDALTLLVAQRVPHRSVEAITPKLIADLQARDAMAVAALTSRGRSEWYSTKVEGVDELTESMLLGMDIDFSKSQLPFVFIQMEGSPFLDHYRKGIFYSNHMENGDFIKKLLEDTGFHPSTVIFVNDKKDSLLEVDEKMGELAIPFVGLWYTRTKADHADFSPMVAHIQLQKLVFDGQILSDEEAQAIIDEEYAGVDPDLFFQELLHTLVEMSRL